MEKVKTGKTDVRGAIKRFQDCRCCEWTEHGTTKRMEQVSFSIALKTATIVDPNFMLWREFTQRPNISLYMMAEHVVPKSRQAYSSFSQTFAGLCTVNLPPWSHQHNRQSPTIQLPDSTSCDFLVFLKLSPSKILLLPISHLAGSSCLSRLLT